MNSASKLKSVDFYMKIPRDLTEASLFGAAFSIMFLFGMLVREHTPLIRR